MMKAESIDTSQPAGAWRLGVPIALAVVAFAVLTGYLLSYTPRPRLPGIDVFDGYDRQGMREAMRPDRVAAHQSAILDCGSRFIGSEGFKAVQDLIRQAYHQAGLEVIEQRINTVAPQTTRREITDPAGAALDGVEIYPFLPNQFQPVSTDDEGVTGTLVLVTDEMLDTRRSFDDCIALLDMTDLPTGMSADWRSYARLGFRAVILAHPEGLDHIRWTRPVVESMVSNVPANYPRLAATEGIFAHVGRPVRVTVQATYVNADNINFIGRLRASSRNAAEAAVVTVQYDAGSWLPDRAPGTMQAAGLAAQLALLDGLVEHREHLLRDVIFVATGSRGMGQAGVVQFLATLGSIAEQGEALRHHQTEQVRHRRLGEQIASVLACFDDPNFGLDERTTLDAFDSLDRATREVFTEQFRYVLNTLLLELREPLMEARLDFMRVGEDIRSDAYRRFLAAQRAHDNVLIIVGYNLGKVVREQQDLVKHHDLRTRLLARFEELARYHREQLARAETAARINELFQEYRQTVIYTPLLVPSLESGASQSESLSFYLGATQTGRLDYHTTLGPQVNDLLVSVAGAAEAPNLRFESLSPRHAAEMHTKIAGALFDSTFWVAGGYPAFGLMHTDRVEAYQQFYSPADLPAMRDLTSMEGSLRMLGDLTLSLAYGNGRFESAMMFGPRRFAGGVLVGGLGRSIVPNYPLANALVGSKVNHPYNSYGRFEQFLMWTDPYGQYDYPFIYSVRQIMTVHQEPAMGYSPVAVGFDDRGRIRFIRDEGPTGQKAYRSMGLHWEKDIDKAFIVVFAATPVTLLDVVNPQTLKGYDAVDFIDSDRLTPVGRFAFFSGDAITRFVEPDQRFYVALKAGTPGNELVQDTRAFMLGIDEGYEPDPHSTREIVGPGFLAADAEFILDVPMRVARSMALINQRRLDLQNRYGMADERTNLLHQRSVQLLEEITDPALSHRELSYRDQTQRAREAVALQTLNHPVLRGTITEAVISILWYLCLLVPFTFFLEKLLFAFPDIRKQLAAHTVIFIVSFALLKLLHPAFEMIRSSLMILLGFVIMLISGGITVLFSGKFQENLEGLRAKRGMVDAADVNTLGVIGTAFMLGLNNMHRRRVRTGLTCTTLALITFAMICFTTTSSDLVDSEVAIGEAGYQGILIKDEQISPILDAELGAVRERFGRQYEVAERAMVVGRPSTTREMLTPQLTVEFERQGVWRSMPARSVLTFDPNEPLAGQVRFVTRREWFPPQPEADLAVMDATPIMLPAPMAEELGIGAEAVDAGEVRIRLNGRLFEVYSIFDPDSLRYLRDLDGKSILPFDVESMQDPRLDADERVLAVEPYTYIDPASIVIARTIDGLALGERILVRRASIAIWLRDPATGDPVPYREAREQIDRYLEQSGRLTYYGLSGIAYSGQRARERSIAGMIDMLIPLIIAALTVLNTIRGSVYERRDEIYVYNAVGIAPRYVFFMFFAEAFVYAVVGTVLGYFLSQGVGRILTEVGWTGGLNMTFTSFSTVLASLAIMGAVFASTLFPAFSAMRIAAPAEESGWDLPEPDGDHLRMMLPFTFDHQDRLAILEFFNRFFLDHGEGSSSSFFCGPPRLGLQETTDDLADGAYIPEVTVTVWLKPYDLGVSQKLSIAMPTDPETGEYVARLTLTRLSGTQKAWMRLNRLFMEEVRKHFLHWRAVGEVERGEMFEEARELMTRHLTEQGALDAS